MEPDAVRRVLETLLGVLAERDPAIIDDMVKALINALGKAPAEHDEIEINAALDIIEALQ